jgi:hypothetical protein
VAKKIRGPADQKLLPSWAVLGPSWAVSGPSWGHLEPILGHLVLIFGLSWGVLGSSLGASWGQLGPSWAVLRAVLGHLGVNLAILGYHLGGFGGCPTRFGGLGQFLKDVPRVWGVRASF